MKNETKVNKKGSHSIKKTSGGNQVNSTGVLNINECSKLNKYRPALYCVECGELIKGNICTNCHRVYVDKNGITFLLSREDETSELFQRFLKNYSIIAEDDIAEDIMPLYYREAQADKIIEYAGQLKSKVVLDVGSGKGLLLKRVRHNNKVAVDISTKLLDLLKNDVTAIFANAENLPFKDQFDCIFMTDVLEHTLNPEKTLKSVWKALKPSGKAIIRVPYHEDLTPYKKESGCKYEFVHLRSFDESSLIEMVKKCDFKVNKLFYDGFSLNNLRREMKDSFTERLLEIFSFINKKKYGLENIEPSHFMCRLPWLGSIVFSARVIHCAMHLPLETDKIDPYICRLPNQVGFKFFRPWEMVIIIEPEKNQICP